MIKVYTRLTLEQVEAIGIDVDERQAHCGRHSLITVSAASTSSMT